MQVRRVVGFGLAGVIVVVLLAAAAYFLLPPWETRDVAMPPSDASPAQVVKTYLDALDSHDCGTARALTAASASDEVGWWCDNLSSVRDVVVRKPFTDNPGATRKDPSARVVNVPVFFDLRWRATVSDVDVADIIPGWGYLLKRNSPDGPWRIFDQGLG